MSDNPGWCPICQVSHPTVDMVRWCKETKGEE